jgi:hypothetical protein
VKVLRPDEQEKKMRAYGDLMKTAGVPVDEMVRKIFEDADQLPLYERARAGMIEAGGDPNDPTLWRAIMQGMSDQAKQNDAHAILSGAINRKMS